MIPVIQAQEEKRERFLFTATFADHFIYHFLIIVIQVVPVPLNRCATEDIKEAFMVQAQEQQMEMMEIPEHTDLKQVPVNTPGVQWFGYYGIFNIYLKSWIKRVCSDCSSRDSIFLCRVGLGGEALLPHSKTFSSAVWKVSISPHETPFVYL